MKMSSKSTPDAGTAHLGPRGVKRKRGKAPFIEPGARLRGKLHHGLKAIHKTAKKEKAFEIQRLVKKKKNIARKPGDNVNYDEQLAIVKALDPEQTANLATKTKIGKDRTLTSNGIVKAAVEAELSSSLLVLSEPGSTARVVESRFLSSKRMAAEIQALLQVLKDELLGTSESKRVTASATSNNGSSDAPVREQIASPDSHGDDGDESSEADAEDNSGEVEDDAGWESGTVSGTDAEDGWESGLVDGADIRKDVGSKGEAASDDDNDSVSEASDASDVFSPPTPKRKKQPDPKVSAAQAISKEPKRKSRTSAAESTFLPSLSVGFIRGDSDASDWSDAEANATDGVRKNRRGQRARRAIWEKKYGRNANHVKKAQDVAPKERQHPSNRMNPHSKGGPRRDRTGPDASEKRPAAHPAFRLPDHRKSSHENAFAASGPAPGRTKPKEDQPLHPSWEAKKRLKEKQNPVILPAQGKKITFN